MSRMERPSRVKPGRASEPEELERATLGFYINSRRGKLSSLTRKINEVMRLINIGWVGEHVRFELRKIRNGYEEFVRCNEVVVSHLPEEQKGTDQERWFKPKVRELQCALDRIDSRLDGGASLAGQAEQREENDPDEGLGAGGEWTATRSALSPHQGQKGSRRVESSDFTLPANWDKMAPGEDLKMVKLDRASIEYHTVERRFFLTALEVSILKIERVQNIHLRQAYEVQKKRIADKNASKGGAAEKFLFHGTSKQNCESIVRMGFNRGFAGKNGHEFGQGTYFALDALYSAGYSALSSKGRQCMLLARVLTGVSTTGRSNMKVPPLVNQEQHVRYDSLVDREESPSMHVICHDSQAYPDYLITFTKVNKCLSCGKCVCTQCDR